MRQIGEFYYHHVAVTVTEVETQIWQVCVSPFLFSQFEMHCKKASRQILIIFRHLTSYHLNSPQPVCQHVKTPLKPKKREKE